MRGVGVPGMTPLAAMSLYYGDVEDDPALASQRKRDAKRRKRRVEGVPEFTASPLKTQNPPCLKCEFLKTCKERQLACNIFAEWTVSRRDIPADIKRLLPSKRWMNILAKTEHLGPIRKEYYMLLERQTGEKVTAPEMGDLFDND